MEFKFLALKLYLGMGPGCPGSRHGSWQLAWCMQVWAGMKRTVPMPVLSIMGGADGAWPHGLFLFRGLRIRVRGQGQGQGLTLI